MNVDTKKNIFKNISSLPKGNEIDLLRQQLNNQQALNDFAKELLNLKSIEEIVWTITENVISRLNLADCVVYITDDTGTKLVQRAAFGPKNPKPKEIDGQLEIPFGEGIVGTVALNGVSEIIGDTRKDPRYILDDQARLSEIAVPIIIDNQVIGVIDSEHPEANFFNDFHLETLTVLASLSAASIKNALYQEELKTKKESLELEVAKRTEEINRAMKELERSNDDLKNYAHVVSHDLKQPLRSINSFTSLILRSEKNLSDKSKGYFKYISDGTLQMQNILNGLLELSKVTDIELEKAPINLNDLIVNVQRGLAKQITESKTKINIDDLPPIIGYETLIYQLFQNLISNSIKFRRKDLSPVIDIIYTEKANTHHFTLTDNGIGMEPDQNDLVFDLFKRLHPADEFEGTGLGLSFCKKIVERHFGKISITSKGPNQGSKVEFYLCKAMKCKNGQTAPTPK